MYDMSRRQLFKGFAAMSGVALVAPALTGRAFAETQTLMLYSGQHAGTTKGLVAAFTKATGIEVKVRQGESPELANQIIEEGAASPADLFYSEESAPVAAIDDKDLLAPVAPATLKAIPAQFVARDGNWIGASARTRVVVYNRNMIKESGMPASVMDFASAAWQDKVGYVPTSGAFQEQIVAIAQLKGRAAALDWLKGLKAYGKAYNGNGAALNAVEAGQVATALINNYYWYALKAERKGQTLNSALFYFGNKDPGALITVSAAAALKSSRQPELAQKFLAFMVSATGQQAIADSVAEYPLRPGVKSPFDLKPWDELDPPPVTPADLGDAADALALEREAGLA
jgi:iron(III) transport system substrate-binding protein